MKRRLTLRQRRDVRSTRTYHERPGNFNSKPTSWADVKDLDHRGFRRWLRQLEPIVGVNDFIGKLPPCNCDECRAMFKSYVWERDPEGKISICGSCMTAGSGMINCHLGTLCSECWFIATGDDPELLDWSALTDDEAERVERLDDYKTEGVIR